MLKADLHLHTCDGIADNFIDYNAFKLIDRATELGFDVLSITNHDSLTYSGYLRDYARERGIILIPGIEMTVRGKHVLVYNIMKKMGNIKNYKDLLKLKNRDTLFIAPHPFFPSGHSLGRKLMQWHELFDAVELSHFYTAQINFNKRAVSKAKELNMPMIGTSDSHLLRQLNTTYTLIDAEKDLSSIIQAVKNGNVVVVSTPLPFSELGLITYQMLLSHSLDRIGTACFSFLSLLGRGAL